LRLKTLKDALIIAALKSFPDLKRQPLMLILVGLVSSIPLFFLLIFGGPIQQGLIGAMIATIGFIGLVAAIQDLTWDRYIKIREMIVAMPVRPVSYAIGIALAPLLISTPGLVFFVAIALWQGFLPVSSLGWTVAALILCWAATSSIGLIISTYLQKASVYTLNSMSNILGLGLIFMPPVYYPEEFLGSFNWVASVFPTSNAASLIRVYSGQYSLPQEIVLARWLILLGIVFASTIVVSIKTKWRET